LLSTTEYRNDAKEMKVWRLSSDSSGWQIECSSKHASKSLWITSLKLWSTGWWMKTEYLMEVTIVR
jgi:hypothetical protein